MAARARKVKESPPDISPQILSPEAQENEMIALAMKQARKQLIEGTASSQIIVHYLKLASSSEMIEKEKAKRELELLEAKTEAIKAAERVEELYSEAIKAFRRCSYDNPGDSDDAGIEDLY